MTPSYVLLFESGELERRATQIECLISPCVLCPFACRVDRKSAAHGRCRSALQPVVASWGPHLGEEPPLVGTRGSGTIFFSNCNLRCVFCQNSDISQSGNGREISATELAEIMVELQERGCHNINLVSPTHFNHAVVRALLYAVPKGLRIPIVYNSGGYDDVRVLRLLRGIIDIYMPDFKFSHDDTAEKLTGARNYPMVAAAAVREMYDQVGDLVVNDRGAALRGLIIRHLVLPDNIAGSRAVIDFIGRISSNTYLNIMDQYHPAYRARSYPGLGKRVTLAEYDELISYAVRSGLRRIQGCRSM